MRAHVGRRRRQPKVPVARLLVLAVAVAAVLRALTLTDPSPSALPVTDPLLPVPFAAGPEPVDLPAALSDGSTYEPRIYLTTQISVGVATTVDGGYVRILRRDTGDRTVELRRVTTAIHPEFDGFVASGDMLVWAESASPPGAGFQTTLWRANWRTAAKAVPITANGGSANFFGSQYDLVIHDGRVSWAAVGSGSGAALSTEIRTVRLSGGAVTVRRLAGAFALSAWPWAVGLAGGRGTPVELVNLGTDARVTVPTAAAEVAVCGPTWCRMGVVGGNFLLVRIDLQRTDGSQRRRIAGGEATPTIADATLLDRYVPLKTDYGDGSAGLSLYDITLDRTELIAAEAANIHARAAILWWSTGFGQNLVWHAIDLRALL